MKIFSIVLLLVSLGSAQNIRIDWPSHKGVTLSGQSAGQVTITVTGVNDFFYRYLIDVTATPQATKDFDTLTNLLQQPGAAAAPEAPPPCLAAAQTAVNNAVAGVKKLSTPKLMAGQYTSIPLSQTQQEWVDNVKLELDKIDVIACPQAQSIPHYKELVDNQQQLLSPIHQVQAVFDAKQCFDYQITVTEQYRGVSTQQAPLDSKFSVECDQLTLSGGTLLTAIQNRSYNSRPIPNQTGQFLSVDGTGSLRPIVLALMNYNLPKFPGRWGDALRLAVSTGPAFQSTGKSDISKFGYFLGGSISLYKRIYLTPGIHWGEFADFPAGFVPGQQIPANFGELTPVKRNTARFALGITVQALDVSKLFHSQPNTPSVKPAGGK